MSESENPKKESGAERENPATPDICSEQRSERLLKGFGVLLLAFALILGADSAWIHIVGFLLVGSGIALLGASWAACTVLVALVMLNEFVVGAGWGESILLLMIGGIVALLSSFWIPVCRKFISATLDFGVKKQFADEKERQFARTLVREFAPVIGFVVCVYVAFGFLGFLEEILTITIVAAFAWCAKMERHYGGSGLSGLILVRGKAANGDDALIKQHSFFSMRAFPIGKRKDNPTIDVGIARRFFGGPIYLVLSVYHCPGEAAKNMQGRIYRLMQIPHLVENATRIMREEMQFRNSNILWHIEWEHLGLFEHGSPTMGNSRMSMHGMSQNSFMILVIFCFWFFIRYRYRFLGRIVGLIGESMGKILYMFHKSTSAARETTRVYSESSHQEVAVLYDADAPRK